MQKECIRITLPLPCDSLHSATTCWACISDSPCGAGFCHRQGRTAGSWGPSDCTQGAPNTIHDSTVRPQSLGLDLFMNTGESAHFQGISTSIPCEPPNYTVRGHSLSLQSQTLLETPAPPCKDHQRPSQYWSKVSSKELIQKRKYQLNMPSGRCLCAGEPTRHQSSPGSPSGAAGDTWTCVVVINLGHGVLETKIFTQMMRHMPMSPSTHQRNHPVVNTRRARKTQTWPEMVQELFKRYAPPSMWNSPKHRLMPGLGLINSINVFLI